MEEILECSNCGTKYKSHFLSVVKPLHADQVALINEYIKPEQKSYCTKCGGSLFDECKNKTESEIASLNRKLSELISYIPVISVQNPFNWNYTIIGMVTAQTTTGTGVFSEFASSFNDLFGKQSKSYNTKLKAGEELCFAQLRSNALNLYSNAVIGVDIDYAEVGGEKGMLMVCMAGTAIKLQNTEILKQGHTEKINEAIKINERRSVLNTILIAATKDVFI